jgi:O-antigen/teichoic acid export membrane protein
MYLRLARYKYHISSLIARKLLYTILMFGATGLGFAKMMLFAFIMPPNDLGYYVAITTATAFASILGLFGLSEYLVKEGSLLSGKGLDCEVIALRNKIISLCFLNSFVIILFGFIISLLFDINRLKSTDYLLVSFILLVNVVYNVIEASQRAMLQYISFSRMSFIRALLLLVFGLALFSYFGLSGVLLAEIFSGLCALIFSFRTISITTIISASRFSVSNLVDLFSKGWSFLGIQIFRYLALSTDKWIVYYLAGSVTLGQYSFALTTLLGFLSVAGLLNAVLIPRLIADFTITGDLSALRHYTINLCSVFCLISVFCAPFYLYFVNLVANHFFNDYLFDHLIWSFGFVYFGSVLYVLSTFFDSFFYSKSTQSALASINALSLIFLLLVFFVVGFTLSSVLYFCFAFMLSKAIHLAFTYNRFQINTSIPC